MFELLINAVKVVASNDVREGIGAAIARLKAAPDWQSDTCSIEARVTREDAERLSLLRKVLCDKLKDLEYHDNPVDRFQAVFVELTENALEHGTASRTVHILTEINPVYVSVEIRGANKRANIAKWIRAAKRHLALTRMRGRGRGLIIAHRKSDSLDETSGGGVKAVVYSDWVKIRHWIQFGTCLVVVTGGNSNPSLGRRLAQYIKHRKGKRLIICLNPGHLSREARLVLTEDWGWDFDRALLALGVSRTFSERPVPSPNFDPDRTDTYHCILKAVEEYAVDRDVMAEQSVRLILSDADVADLLPKDLISTSIAEAVKSLDSR